MQTTISELPDMPVYILLLYSRSLQSSAVKELQKLLIIQSSEKKMQVETASDNHLI